MSGIHVAETPWMSLTLSKDILNGVSCLRINIDHPSAEVSTRLWVAPEQGLTLQKMQVVERGKDEEQILESYEASYKQQTPGGPWLVSSALFVSQQGPIHETVRATVNETAVNVDVPDEIFTFEGLGVPKGVPLYDKQLGNATLESRYGSVASSEQLDQLITRIQSDTRATSQPAADDERNKTALAVVINPPTNPSAAVAQATRSSMKYYLSLALGALLIIAVLVGSRIRSAYRREVPSHV